MNHFFEDKDMEYYNGLPNDLKSIISKKIDGKQNNIFESDLKNQWKESLITKLNCESKEICQYENVNTKNINDQIKNSFNELANYYNDYKNNNEVLDKIVNDFQNYYLQRTKERQWIKIEVDIRKKNSCIMNQEILNNFDSFFNLMPTEKKDLNLTLEEFKCSLMENKKKCDDDTMKTNKLCKNNNYTITNDNNETAKQSTKKIILRNLIKSLNIIINYPGSRKNSLQNICIIDLPKSVENFLSSIGKFENEEFDNDNDLKKLAFEYNRITSIFCKISISNVQSIYLKKFVKFECYNKYDKIKKDFLITNSQYEDIEVEED
uniref:Unspecified product n=1 Tax=Strongyloides papillosus TaxID=174720 RepID=A0A0N5C1N2_STREA